MRPQVPLSRFDSVTLDYEKYKKKLEVVRSKLNRPLTLSEKILYSHLDDPESQVRRLGRAAGREGATPAARTAEDSWETGREGGQRTLDETHLPSA